MSAFIPDLPLWKDFEWEVDVVGKDSDTGRDKSADGLTDLSAYVETTIGGGAVHPSLKIALTERPAWKGRYAGVFNQPDLAQYLAAFDGRTIWICLQKPLDVDVERFQRVVRAESQG